MKPTAQLHVGVAGRYKLAVFKAIAQEDGTTAPGELVRETPWFDNIITNAGKNLLAHAAFLSACHAGTGTATPAAGDSALSGFVAATTTIVSTNTATASGSPYFASLIRVYQFAPGVAAGNIAEVGVAGTGVSTGPLFSRALVLDGDGDPTTITVLSDEYLQVTYQLRLYPPTVDVTGTVTIDGDDYDYTLRAANVTSSVNWVVPTSGSAGIAGSSKTASEFTGTIGAITGSPGGSAGPGQGMPVSNSGSYVDGNYYQDVKFTHTINHAGTVQSFIFGTLIGQYQFQLSPSLTIGSTQQLDVVIRMSWDRGSETP